MELNAIAIKEEIKPFDYSQLDPKVSEYLQEKVYRMHSILSGYYTEIGKELKEAQETLSVHRNGCFEEWYESIGLKKVTVYNLINRYNFIVQNMNDKKFIEEMQISLSYEIAKPNAPKELVEKVLNGEITTHKEYVDIIKANKPSKPKKEIVKKVEFDISNGVYIQGEGRTITEEKQLDQFDPISSVTKDDLPDETIESNINNIGADADEVEEPIENLDGDNLYPNVDVEVNNPIVAATNSPEVITSPFDENIAIANDIDNKLDDAEPLIESDSFTQAELDEMYNQYHKLEKRLLNIKRVLKNRVPIDKKKNKPGQGRPPKSPNKVKDDKKVEDSISNNNTQEVTQ